MASETKLSIEQREVLESGASAVCVSGRWIWRNSFSQPRGQQVRSLRTRGLVDVVFYSGGKAEACATDAGRKILAENAK